MVMRILFELFSQRRIARWNAVVGGPLKNRQVGGCFGHHRNGLNASRSGANHAHPLAHEVNAFMRPLPGVIPLALEGIKAFDLRHIGGRHVADRGDQVLGLIDVTRISRGTPHVELIDITCRGHQGVEANVRSQVELVGDMIHVTPNLGMAGKALSPLPLFGQFFRKIVLVGMTF